MDNIDVLNHAVLANFRKSRSILRIFFSEFFFKKQFFGNFGNFSETLEIFWKLQKFFETLVIFRKKSENFSKMAPLTLFRVLRAQKILHRNSTSLAEKSCIVTSLPRGAMFPSGPSDNRVEKHWSGQWGSKLSKNSRF